MRKILRKCNKYTDSEIEDMIQTIIAAQTASRRSKKRKRIHHDDLKDDNNYSNDDKNCNEEESDAGRKLPPSEIPDDEKEETYKGMNKKDLLEVLGSVGGKLQKHHTKVTKNEVVRDIIKQVRQNNQKQF